MPTAISASNENLNHLIVADSGANSDGTLRNHLRLYDTSTATPTLAGTFGRSMGMGVRGQVQPDKFDFIIGCGRDSSGSYFVAWNGTEMGDGMGTVIRKLTPQGDLLWKLYGLVFIGGADIDSQKKKPTSS